MPDFVLHPRLAADTRAIAELPLCRVLLMNDSRFPWLILVPRRAGARELVDLAPEDRRRLAEETDAAARALRDACPTDKLNIAAIGNIVEQLHVHIVARRKGDAAWPGVVWGHGAATPYEPATAAALAADLARRLMTE
ncbi:MAG: HIT domain-containing protein [Alphaproteobacteria bacterium]